MNEWEKETIHDLKQYRYWQESLCQIPGMLEALASEAAAVRCSLSGTEPVSGGGSNYEQERLTYILLRREKLSHRYAAVKKQVALLAVVSPMPFVKRWVRSCVISWIT